MDDVEATLRSLKDQALAATMERDRTPLAGTGAS